MVPLMHYQAYLHFISSGHKENEQLEQLFILWEKKNLFYASLTKNFSTCLCGSWLLTFQTAKKQADLCVP